MGGEGLHPLGSPIVKFMLKNTQRNKSVHI